MLFIARPNSASHVRAAPRVVVVLVLSAALSACAADKPQPKCQGQVRVLNAGKWPPTENDLKSACLSSRARFASLAAGTHL
jgi:hypothetical protein